MWRWLDVVGPTPRHVTGETTLPPTAKTTLGQPLIPTSDQATVRYLGNTLQCHGLDLTFSSRCVCKHCDVYGWCERNHTNCTMIAKPNEN